MQQAATSAAPAADSGLASASPDVPEGPREIVIRPDGMRKGVWEASNGYFYVAAGILGVVLVVWLLFRFGVVKLPKRKKKEEEAPKSRRGRSGSPSKSPAPETKKS